MSTSTTFAAFGAAIAVMAGFGGAAASTAPMVWLDPSTLPFVPTPVIVQALAPTQPGASCAGAALYSPGSVPPDVRSVVLHVETEACLVSWADVLWTVGGVTYHGVVDLATGAVTRIREVAREPEPAPAGTSVQAPSGGPMWESRTGHVWLHFWAKSGSGNENVKTNHNWRYAGPTQRETTFFENRCDADGVWNSDACWGNAVNGQSAHGRGEFHADVWPYDYHAWDTFHRILADQTSAGHCAASGDLPWSYGSSCEVGAGNV